MGNCVSGGNSEQERRRAGYRSITAGETKMMQQFERINHSIL